MHDTLGEVETEVAVVDASGRTLSSVDLVKGHLWVVVESRNWVI